MTGHLHSDNRPMHHEVTTMPNKNTPEHRIIVSDIDDLIDQIRDYRQDMPKALLPDEDEKITIVAALLLEDVLPAD